MPKQKAWVVQMTVRTMVAGASMEEALSNAPEAFAQAMEQAVITAVPATEPIDDWGMTDWLYRAASDRGYDPVTVTVADGIAAWDEEK
jgi:hypothetical protein